jgi:hypothetical protein
MSARTHLSIQRTLQDSVTQIQSAVNRVDNGDAQVPAPWEELSRCSSDYSSDSESDSTESELKKMKRDRVLVKYARVAEEQERALDKAACRSLLDADQRIFPRCRNTYYVYKQHRQLLLL